MLIIRSNSKVFFSPLVGPSPFVFYGTPYKSSCKATVKATLSTAAERDPGPLSVVQYNISIIFTSFSILISSFIHFIPPRSPAQTIDTLSSLTHRGLSASDTVVGLKVSDEARSELFIGRKEV